MNPHETNKEIGQTGTKPQATLAVRVIGWIFFVLAFVAAFFLVRKLM